MSNCHSTLTASMSQPAIEKFNLVWPRRQRILHPCRHGVMNGCDPAPHSWAVCLSSWFRPPVTSLVNAKLIPYLIGSMCNQPCPWGQATKSNRSCGEPETMQHIINECPLTRFNSELEALTLRPNWTRRCYVAEHAIRTPRRRRNKGHAVFVSLLWSFMPKTPSFLLADTSRVEWEQSLALTSEIFIMTVIVEDQIQSFNFMNVAKRR